MKIGIAGPVTVGLLADLVTNGDRLPSCYSFPLIAQIAREYHRLGHEITVFATSASVTEPQIFSGSRCTIRIVPMRTSGWRKALDRFATERRYLAAEMRTAGCDVVHAHWTYEFALAALDAGLPTLVTAHDAPWVVVRQHLQPRNLVYRVSRALMAGSVLRKIPELTVVSPYLENALRKTHRHVPAITVIPNGLPDHLFSDTGPRRTPFGQADVVFAAVVMGFDHRKNTTTLLRAWEMFHRTAPHATLRLYGADHGPNEACAAWAQKANCSTAGVEFRGRTPYDDLQHQLIHEVDALIHPSLEESFCMAAAEALVHRLPCIGGRQSGGLPWVLGDGEAGTLVDVTSPTALAEALRTMLQNPQPALVKAALGRTRAETLFRLSTVAERYLAALARVARR